MSEYRVVTKTATRIAARQHLPSRLGAGRRKVELVFCPFDLETVQVRYHDKSYGKALPHTIPATPIQGQTGDPRTRAAAGTGIDYLELTATAHHEQLRHDERIGYSRPLR
nr:hypothetical protein [Mycobacterium riyadhense]